MISSHPSERPAAELFEDAHRIILLINSRNNYYSILSLQIEFNHYFYKNKLNQEYIHERFKNAYQFLTAQKVIYITNGFINIDKQACEAIISTFTRRKNKIKKE